MKYLAYITAILFFGSIYFLIAKPYPYYLAWDSSMFFSVDAMIASAGQIPDHFFHPNTIPLVLDRWIFLPLGKELGFISVSSISALQKIPNPYLAFVETTSYLIGLEYLFVAVFLIFLTMSVQKLLNPLLLDTPNPFFISFTAVILCICWGSLPHQLYWIRYETIGLTFWSIALFFTVLSAEHSDKKCYVWIAGIFSGAAILSKIQLLGGIIALPFLYFFLAEVGVDLSRRQKQYAVGQLLVIFTFISLVHASAYYQFIHHTLISAAFTRELQLGHFFPLAPISLLAIAASSAILFFYFPSFSKRFHIHLKFLSDFLFAAFSTLMFSLLLGNNWSERMSALHLSYIYSYMLGQICTFGQTQGCNPKVVSSFSNELLALYCVFIFGILLIFTKLKRFKTGKWIYGAIAIVLLLASIKVFLRFDSPEKDGLMQASWLTLAGILLWRLTYFAYPVKNTIYFGVILAWIAITYQGYQLLKFQRDFFTKSAYQYNIDKWKSFTYGFRGNQYVQLIEKAYPTSTSWSTVFSWSKDLPEIQLLLKQVIRDRNFKIKDTILCEPGNYISIEKDEKIMGVPLALRGGLMLSINEATRISPRDDFRFYLLQPSLSSQEVNEKDNAHLMITQSHNADINYFEFTELQTQEQNLRYIPANSFLVFKKKL